MEIAKFLGTLTIQADKKSLKKPLISCPKKGKKVFFARDKKGFGGETRSSISAKPYA